MAEASLTQLTVAEAIRQALTRALAEKPEVFVMGEGVTDPKAIFGTLRGLAERFGTDRVIEMPVSENAFTGIAIGAALLGQRPVVVHQRVEFLLPAMEQLIDNAAKLRYLSLGRQTVPMVVRAVIGRGWGQGPQHSQSLESLFAAIPGLKVVMPSTPADARDLLWAGIIGQDPMIFLEHRWLHAVRGAVPDEYDATVLAGPTVRRSGSDMTLVATSLMVHEALRAAEALQQVGVELEVVDLRVLRPLELAPVMQSVRRTGRLLTLDTGHRTLGIGAEVVSAVVEQLHGDLLAAPKRLGLPDRPAASARSLAGAFYPRAEQAVEAVADVLSMSHSRRAQALEIVSAQRDHQLVDVPDLSFKGPF